jgi:hypothetical protein
MLIIEHDDDWSRLSYRKEKCGQQLKGSFEASDLEGPYVLRCAEGKLIMARLAEQCERRKVMRGCFAANMANHCVQMDFSVITCTGDDFA